jgi:hypothetical protein
LTNLLAFWALIDGEAVDPRVATSVDTDVRAGVRNVGWSGCFEFLQDVNKIIRFKCVLDVFEIVFCKNLDKNVRVETAKS